MIKRILVNRHHINHNVRHPENPVLPVLSTQTSQGITYGFAVHIDGPSQLVYRPTKPLSCGAAVWIETTAPVTVYETMDDVKGKVIP